MNPPAGCRLHAMSLLVHCDDPAEVNRLWEALPAGGGQEIECGWLNDKYGVPWQIWPSEANELLGGGDAAGVERALQAMYSMKKIDVNAMRAAYEGTRRLKPSGVLAQILQVEAAQCLGEIAVTGVDVIVEHGHHPFDIGFALPDPARRGLRGGYPGEQLPQETDIGVPYRELDRTIVQFLRRETVQLLVRAHTADSNRAAGVRPPFRT